MNHLRHRVARLEQHQHAEDSGPRLHIAPVPDWDTAARDFYATCLAEWDRRTVLLLAALHRRGG